MARECKVYLRDSGLLHALLGIRTRGELLDHPRCGASWEGFAVEAVIRRLDATEEECHFWATHAGAELDLLFVRGRQRIGFEIKRSATPGMTSSMHAALDTLRLSRLFVVHGGAKRYPLGRRAEAVPLRDLSSRL